MATGEFEVRFLAYFDSNTSHLLSICLLYICLSIWVWMMRVTGLTSLISRSCSYFVVVDLIAILVV